MENLKKLKVGRKRLLANLSGAFLVLAVVAFFAPSARADAVSGVCSNCHTMHNSQNNVAMRLGSSSVTGLGSAECNECHQAQRKSLLRYGCMGCHGSSPESPVDIKVVGSVGNVPQVFHTDQVSPLAGGSFSWVGLIGQQKGHNVHGMVSIGVDGDLANNPPGYMQAFNPVSVYDPNYQSAGLEAARKIFCAGVQGCHGDRSQVSQDAAMKGTHHADDSAWQADAATPTTVGMATQANGSDGYRMLAYVKGIEATDWENSWSATDHNVYIAHPENYAGRDGTGWSTADLFSMTSFCAQCHGNFHAIGAGIGMEASAGSGVWIRHPADVAMPNYAPYNSYSAYDVGKQFIEVPVAWNDVSGDWTGAVVNQVNTNYSVFCLSCHRAHASEYDDSMRFDTSDLTSQMITGQTDPAYKDTGCFTCHSDVDAP